MVRHPYHFHRGLGVSRLRQHEGIQQVTLERFSRRNKTTAWFPITLKRQILLNVFLTFRKAHFMKWKSAVITSITGNTHSE